MKQFSLLILLIVITYNANSQDKLTKKERANLHRIGFIIVKTHPDAISPSEIGLLRTGDTIDGIPEDEYYEKSDIALKTLNGIVDEIDPYSLITHTKILDYIKSRYNGETKIEIVELKEELQDLLSDPPSKKNKSNRFNFYEKEDEAEVAKKRSERQKRNNTIFQHLKDNKLDALLIITVQHWSTLRNIFVAKKGFVKTLKAYMAYVVSIRSKNKELLFLQKHFSEKISLEEPLIAKAKYSKVYHEFIDKNTIKTFNAILGKPQ